MNASVRAPDDRASTWNKSKIQKAEIDSKADELGVAEENAPRRIPPTCFAIASKRGSPQNWSKFGSYVHVIQC